MNLIEELKNCDINNQFGDFNVVWKWGCERNISY